MSFFKSNIKGHAALSLPDFKMKVVSTTLGLLPKMLPNVIVPTASIKTKDRPHSNALPIESSKPRSMMTKQDSNYDFSSPIQ